MNWKASWIWLDGTQEEGPTTLLARRVVHLKARPPRALLAISASHIYRFYINGEFVGRGPDRADPRFPYYDTYEVANLLRPGANVLLCLLWHSTPAGENRSWCLYNGPGGFLAQLEANGEIVGTDASWRMIPAPGWLPTRERISRFVSFKHVVNLGEAAEQGRAAQPDYNDSHWARPVVMPFAPEGPLPRPIPREIPLLVRTPRECVHMGIIEPRYPSVQNARGQLSSDSSRLTTVHPTPEGTWLTFDFGRPMGGFPEILLQPQGAGSVEIYCGEGNFWVMTDVLHLPASGEVRFEPLDWRGARYVALHFCGLAGPVRVKSVRFIEMVYPFQPRGEFLCSDPTLTKLWRICRETAHVGTKDHPVDCVTREQALWIADLNVHARTMAACFGDVRPAIKGIRQALRVMHDDGVVPVPGPVGIGYQRTPESLPWSEQPLTISMTLLDIYRFTGDRNILAEAIGSLEKMYRLYERYEDARGLLQVSPPGLPALMPFGGWNPFLKQGIPSALNFEYSISLRAASEVAAALGRHDLAGTWRKRSERVRTSARAAFWDADRYLFIDGENEGRRVEAVSPTANAWAAIAGAVQRQEAGAWAEALRWDGGILPPITPYDASLLLEAFLLLGLELHARELLDNYFGSIVANNEPTMPEFWIASERSGARYREDFSRCHPYGTGPAYAAAHFILGASPASPGWGRALIAPRSLGLSWAKGIIPTPKGDIEIAWERTRTSWSLDVNLPEGIGADVVLPRIGWCDERLVVDGRTVWSVDRQTEMQPQNQRQRLDSAPRLVRCALESPGPHRVILES